MIGIVSEKMIMYDRLTAKENLWFFGSLFNIPKDVLTKRVDELLELVELTKWKNAQVGTFSTGMRQRMNVVRALLNLPQVLFLDEPTLLSRRLRLGISLKSLTEKTAQPSS